ncbi:Gfo/Idh/MocA family oxidoreductase [Streptomyces sp. NPDC042207]|uniref:Gfo/Idh/MocA family protein n=1 Tax=Streptomyces sp. NPDC042207 TaxID=3154331 RepID=UPI0033E7BDC2
MRVAVVGLGWAGRSIWLPRLHEHPGFTVVAAVDSRPDARRAVAREGMAATVQASADELDPRSVDLAVVAVPNHLHTAVGAELLARGIPVFLEKPVCLTSGEADQLAEAEHRGGSVLLAGSAARYRADVRALYGLAGELGELRHIELSWVRARGVPDMGGWFTRRRMSGGGALVDLGWHLFDTIAPLLGGARFEQVVGTVSDDFMNGGSWRASWRQDAPVSADEGGDVEDTARGFLVTEDGVSVSLRASWASHETHDVTLVRVEGSAGTAVLRCTFGFSPNRVGAATLTWTRNGEAQPVTVPDEPVGSEYLGQIDELPRMLAEPGGAGRAVEEARRTIGVIERFYASARRAPWPVTAGR